MAARARAEPRRSTFGNTGLSIHTENELILPSKFSGLSNPPVTRTPLAIRNGNSEESEKFSVIANNSRKVKESTRTQKRTYSVVPGHHPFVPVAEIDRTPWIKKKPGDDSVNDSTASETTPLRSNTSRVTADDTINHESHILNESYLSSVTLDNTAFEEEQSTNGLAASGSDSPIQTRHSLPSTADSPERHATNLTHPMSSSSFDGPEISPVAKASHTPRTTPRARDSPIRIGQLFPELDGSTPGSPQRDVDGVDAIELIRSFTQGGHESPAVRESSPLSLRQTPTMRELQLEDAGSAEKKSTRELISILTTGDDGLDGLLQVDPEVDAAKDHVALITPRKGTLNSLIEMLQPKPSAVVEDVAEEAPLPAPTPARRQSRASIDEPDLRVTMSGCTFLKFGRRGRPHRRHVWFDSLSGRICWKEPGRSEKERSIEISTIQSVEKGCDTQVFRRFTSVVRREAHLCLSIVCSERTLDLKMENMMQRDLWYNFFRSLLRYCGRRASATS
eukprot:TRINITY_DN19039_c0_g1_i1.p1 TRINITY_DN19039_c0_g1~~TRINITY_DN19039_c0_g1_i1.p1  ORF type:complete len:506 (-),score=120.51 TRINITY_DN19039_c0_g1_i1:61-1578(-)